MVKHLHDEAVGYWSEKKNFSAVMVEIAVEDGDVFYLAFSYIKNLSFHIFIEIWKPQTQTQTSFAELA